MVFLESCLKAETDAHTRTAAMLHPLRNTLRDGIIRVMVSGVAKNEIILHIINGRIRIKCIKN